MLAARARSGSRRNRIRINLHQKSRASLDWKQIFKQTRSKSTSLQGAYGVSRLSLAAVFTSLANEVASFCAVFCATEKAKDPRVSPQRADGSTSG